MTVPGIGPIIASAMVATIGDGSVFHRGRDFGAWLGLVPRQTSTGDSSPIALHSASLVAATAALGSLPRRVASDRTGPSGDYWPDAELHDEEIEEPPVEITHNLKVVGLNPTPATKLIY